MKITVEFFLYYKILLYNTIMTATSFFLCVYRNCSSCWILLQFLLLPLEVFKISFKVFSGIFISGMVRYGTVPYEKM